MTYVSQSSVLAIGVLFIVLSILAVFARFYVRQKKLGYWLDDWLCIPALILVIAECCIMIIGSATNTVGSHSPPNIGMGTISYDGADLITIEELEFPFDLMQIVTLMTLKLTFLFFYRRIFRGRVFNVASWFLIGVVVAWAIAFFIAILAACGTSIRANFQTLGLLKDECVDTFVILICLAVFDVVVDLAIMVLPIPSIWALQMPVRQKLAVTGTFLVGGLAIACGVTRMAIFAQILGPSLFTQSSVAGVASDDSIGIISLLMFWGMLEMGVALIAVCLPTLRPLFHGWSPESIIRSFRSALSLGSVGSRKRGHHSSESITHDRSESETSLAQAEAWEYAANVKQNRVYAMGSTTAGPDEVEQVPAGSVGVRRDFTQVVESV